MQRYGAGFGCLGEADADAGAGKAEEQDRPGVLVPGEDRVCGNVGGSAGRKDGAGTRPIYQVTVAEGSECGESVVRGV